MYYELYADSLFLVNFVMNLYLLLLVNRSTLRTATRRGILLGAGAGASIYLLPFLLNMPMWLKWPVALATGMGMMIGLAFRPKNFSIFFKILRQLLWYSFLMGGLLLGVGNVLPFLRKFMTGICGVLGIGTVGFWILDGFLRRDRQNQNNSICKAVLVNGEVHVSVNALLDSGNSLREPVSGKPVSVIDRATYRALWGESDRPYRAIPYHSIGKSKGILAGYLLPELYLEVDGLDKRLHNVYVAVCEEESGVGMILNPELLAEDERFGKVWNNRRKKNGNINRAEEIERDKNRAD